MYKRQVKDSRITRNIMHVNRKPAADIDRTMITLDSWGGYPESTFISGNSFYDTESSRLLLTDCTHNFFEGNYYIARLDRKSTRLSSSHSDRSRMPSSA